MKLLYRSIFSLALTTSITLANQTASKAFDKITQEQIKASAIAHASMMSAPKNLDDFNFIPQVPYPPVFPANPIIDEGQTAVALDISINTDLSGNKDWIGIYREGDDNSWNNVIDWAWVKDNHVEKFKRDVKLSRGSYDIRLFFNNSYKVEDSYSFEVQPAKAPIKTIKDSYKVNETVSVNVQMELSNNKDWIGIFPKGTDNSWNNVIKWNWVNKNGTVSLTKGTNTLQAGEYEARLFYNNEYGANVKTRAKYPFAVVGNGKTTNYGKLGKLYINKIDEASYGEYGKVFHIKGKTNLPTVIFIGGDKKVDFCRYIASWGYNVVATPFLINTTPKRRYPNIKRILEIAKNNHQADISKLGIIGKSYTGGQIFYLMKELKKNHIAGNVKSAGISLDGWYPFDMKKKDMHEFTTPTMFIQYGGADGIDTRSPDVNYPFKFYQDPYINMTNFKELTAVKVKSFIHVGGNTLKGNTHGYEKGNLNELQQKLDLMKPIHQFLDYNLKTKPIGYQPKNQIDEVSEARVNPITHPYRFKCDDHDVPQFNFCNLNNPIYK